MESTTPQESGAARGASGAVRPVLPPRGHEVIGARAAEERFGLSADIGKPGHDHASTIRLYGAGLHIRGDLVARHGARRCADNIVVDGDLVIDGALDWWEDPDGPQRFLLVTGDLKARSVHLGECVDLVVRGDVEVSGGVFAWSLGEGPLDGDTTLTARNVRARCVSLHGHVDMVVHGDLVAACGILGRGVDDRGSLSVAGRTRVGELVTADWFTVTPTGPREVGRSAAVDLRGLPEGLPELRELIRPELLGDVGDTDDPLGRELGDRIEAALAAGMPVLRDTPGPQLAASADEVARLRARPAEVTELDLATHRALWQDPERVLDFTALRRLRLAGNRWSGADRLLARLGEFPHLKELDISNMALAQLPAEICLLRGLQVLNIADNPTPTRPPTGPSPAARTSAASPTSPPQPATGPGVATPPDGALRPADGFPSVRSAHHRCPPRAAPPERDRKKTAR